MKNFKSAEKCWDCIVSICTEVIKCGVEACTVYGRYVKKTTELVCSTLGGKMFARFSSDTPDVCICVCACECVV
jgi:hypothetical protein